MLDRLDLVLAALLSVAGVIFSAVEPPLSLRVVVAVPLLLFVPGYLLVLSLLPRATAISALERLGLSLASSAALVGLASLFLSLSPVRFSALTLAAALGLLIVLLIASADRQRRAAALDGDEAFVPFALIERQRSRKTSSPWSPARLFLVAAFLLSLGAAGLVAVVPPLQEHYTELLAHDTTEPSSGVNQNLTIEVRNHEGTLITYTIENYLMNQSLDPTTNRTMTQGMSLLNRSVVTVEDRLSANVTLSVPPNGTAGANRLGVLLFRGEVSLPDGVDEGRLREGYRNLSIRLPEGVA